MRNAARTSQKRIAQPKRMAIQSIVLILTVLVVGTAALLLTNSVESSNGIAPGEQSALHFSAAAAVGERDLAISLLPFLDGPTAFSNPAPITITDSGTPPTAASPYPSNVSVSGMAGVVSNVTVTLNNLTHPRSDNVDVLLVSPTGANLFLLSDVGGAAVAASNVTLNLDDAAGTSLPNVGALSSGTFKPTNYNSPGSESFPSPAPPSGYSSPAPSGSATFASSFNGIDPNGTWSLYVVDDAAGGAGAASFAGGWSLTVTTAAGAATTTVVSSSQNPSFTTAPSNSVTLTATVSSDSGTPSGGTVQFKDNGVNIGGPVALVSGSASVVTTFATEGIHRITADYSGVPLLFGQSSGALLQEVNNHTVVTGNDYCNPGTISITDSNTTGQSPSPAVPYPSRVFVSGLSGTVATVTVQLKRITQARPDNIDILLVGPSGANAIIMSDVGNTNAASNVTLTLDDAAATSLTSAPLVSGTFKPTNLAPADTFPRAPTPAGGSALSAFTGIDPNGVWSLYVVDDAAGGAAGSITDGWCVTITTSPAAATTTAVVSSVNPSFTTAPGNSVTFTAVVTSGSGTPTGGTVQFKDNGVNIGAAVPLSSGLANVTTTFATEGNHLITASYSGNPGLFGPSSGSLIQEVNNHTAVMGNEFCNPGPVTVTDFSQTGVVPSPANPYPSKVFVSGLSGAVCRVQLTLNGVSAQRPRDLDLLLVGPTGSTLIPMSDAGGTSSTVSSPVTLILDDSAASNLPDDSGGPLTDGTFKPTNYGTGDGFPPPAPAASANTTFASAFNGSNPNGTWSLYVVDDSAGGGGGSIGGWCLTFTVDTATAITTQPTDQTACEGSPASFTVVAAGGGTVTYQWRRGTTPLVDGGSISGATTPTLSINPVSASDAGNDYNVVVTGTCGSVTSNNVSLTVSSPPPPPTITPNPTSVCPNSSGNQASGPAGAASYAWSILNGTINGATNNQTVSYTAGGFGNVTLTLTVTNAAGCGATNTADVPISDTQDPVITCPANITTSNDPNACSANVNPGTATATDNCGTPTVAGVRSDSQPLNAPYPKGTTTITWTATDGANNTDTCQQTITVNDTQNPAITCPANITTSTAPNACSANVNPGTATATDNCAGTTVAGVRSDSQPLNAPYPKGTTTITWTATDASGNTASCQQTVTVNDTQSPTITCPANITVPGNPSTCSANVNPGTATATDNCPGVTVTGTRSDSQPLNAPYPAGTTTITWTATDSSGNTSSCQQTVTVTSSQLTALGPAQVWVGVKNSDDVGTTFDFLAEVLRNGVVVGSGQITNQASGSSGFNNAILRVINMALAGPTGFCTGDTMSFRLSVRVAASGGHTSGTARLWYNDAAANSRFTATINGVTNDYYLRDGFVLATTAGPGPKKTIDVLVNRNVGGNPFKPFGTWSKTF